MPSTHAAAASAAAPPGGAHAGRIASRTSSRPKAGVDAFTTLLDGLSRGGGEAERGGDVRGGAAARPSRPAATHRDEPSATDAPPKARRASRETQAPEAVTAPETPPRDDRAVGLDDAASATERAGEAALDDAAAGDAVMAPTLTPAETDGAPQAPNPGVVPDMTLALVDQARAAWGGTPPDAGSRQTVADVTGAQKGPRLPGLPQAHPELKGTDEVIPLGLEAAAASAASTARLSGPVQDAPVDSGGDLDADESGPVVPALAAALVLPEDALAPLAQDETVSGEASVPQGPQAPETRDAQGSRHEPADQGGTSGGEWTAISDPAAPMTDGGTTFAAELDGAAAVPPPGVDGDEHGVSQQLVQAMRLQWRDGAGQATITLRPEHLGQVRISLRLEGGTLQAHLQVEDPQVRAWIESHADTLRQGLAGQGLDLDRLVVSEHAGGEQRRDGDGRDRRQPRRTPGWAGEPAEPARFEVRV